MEKRTVRTVDEAYSVVSMLASLHSPSTIYFYQSGLDLIDIWSRSWRSNIVKLKFLGTHNFIPKEGIHVVVLWDSVEDLSWLEVLLSDGQNYIVLNEACVSYSKAATVYD